MLFSEPIITYIADFLQKHAKNIPIILDPVMVAKSGDSLLLPNAISSLKGKLIPLATVITPNLLESYKLIDTYEEDYEVNNSTLLFLTTTLFILPYS